MRTLFADKRFTVLTLTVGVLLANGCNKTLPNDGANAAYDKTGPGYSDYKP
jgi:hypothetical protein